MFVSEVWGNPSNLDLSLLVGEQHCSLALVFSLLIAKNSPNHAYLFHLDNSFDVESFYVFI